MRPFHRPFLRRNHFPLPPKSTKIQIFPRYTYNHDGAASNCCNPSCTSTLPALNIQGRWQATAKPAQIRTVLSCCRDHKKNTRTHTTQRRHGRGGQRGKSCGGGLVRACCYAYRQRSTGPLLRGCKNCPFLYFSPPAFELFSLVLLATPCTQQNNGSSFGKAWLMFCTLKNLFNNFK